MSAPLLASGDVFSFRKGKFKRRYVVVAGTDELYANASREDNDIIFDDLGLDSHKYAAKHYGYEVNELSDFPEAHAADFAALTRLILALAAEAERQGWTVSLPVGAVAVDLYADLFA